jgi:hypothetical protein
MPCCKFLFALFLLFTIASLNATTRIVDINGSGQYTSIQTAINASSPGDSVLVYPGRYYEFITIQTNNLSLISLEHLTNNHEYIDTTIVDGSASSLCIRVMDNIQNVMVRGFSFNNGRGILLYPNSQTRFENCNIYGNQSFDGAGMYIAESTAHLSGVKIFDNYALNQGGGMYIYGYMGTVNVTFDPINRCSIYNNRAGVGQDIVAHSINGDLSIPLEMFTVANPSSYYAAPLRAWGNEFQLHIDANTAYHQEINSDLYVSPDGDDANDGLSPASALKTIHTAVYKIASDSLNQKTVHLLPGTYSRTANQQMFPIALKSWVKVKGAGMEETMIIGEPDPIITNQTLKVFASLDQKHIGMEGMSITTQNTDNSCALWGFREDQVILKNVRMHELSPKNCAIIDISYVTNCDWDNITIENFTTVDYGFMRSTGYWGGAIKNSIFRNAGSTFMSVDVSASPLFWIEAYESITLEHCIFANISMLDDDTQTIQFGGSHSPSDPRYILSNCLFINNNNNERLMILHGQTNPIIDLVNCTFAGQTGLGEALMVNGTVNITNSIFYNNGYKEIAINPMDGIGLPTTLTLNNNLIRNGYSDIWQGPGSTINYSTTNITGNPLFTGGDIANPMYYSLSADSPCINAGTPDTTGLSLLPYDLAGNVRVWNSVIDMGCYEFGAPPATNDDPVAPQLSGGISATNYPNPFNPETSIRFHLPQSGLTEICVYNLKGQMVRRLLSDNLVAGMHTVQWNGRDDNKQPVASGMYLYRVQSGKQYYMGKMVLMK